MARARLGRYSRAVRVLRIGLPLAAIALLSSVFLIQRDDFAGGFRFSAADFEALEDGLRLTDPRFTGTTEKGEPYVLRAEWALPDAPDPTEVVLHALRGEITMEDGRKVMLTAADGVLRPKDETVALKGGVTITTSDGYRAETSEAMAEVGTRSLTAPGAIVAEGPLGRIEAGRMRMVRPEAGKGDEMVVFEKSVRVIYRPKGATTAPGGP